MEARGPWVVVLALLLCSCSDDNSSSPPDASADSTLPSADAQPSPDLDAGAPDAAGPDGPGPGPRPVWLLHLADVHLGAQPFAEEALKTAVQYVEPVVAPFVTVNVGDMTEDGSTGQWTTYQGIIQGKVAAYPGYLELLGNHDVKADDGKSFIAGSETGKAGGGFHGISYIDGPSGRVQMVRTNTCDSSTALNQLLGYISEAQVQSLKAEPPSAVPVAHRVVLGHHPLKGPQSLQVLGTVSRMESLLAHFGAEVYLCGHAHLAALSWSKQTLVVQGPTLGKPTVLTPSPGFAVVALDMTGPAARIFGLTKSSPAVVDWPLVLITTPADVDLGGTNPMAQPIAPGRPDLVVRALGFAPKGVQTAEARFDDGAWTPMSIVDAWVYQTTLTAPTTGKRKLEVRVQSPEGTGTHAISVTIGP